MGNLVGILILTFYMVNIDLAHIGATLSAVYLSSSMFLNMTVSTADAFGFGSIFKHCMFVPFISTLLPRLAYNQPQPINGEFYLLYLSILLFLIGLCQKLASINRSKPFTSQSDCLILGAAVLLGPINVISASIVIMCAALYWNTTFTLLSVDALTYGDPIESSRSSVHIEIHLSTFRTNFYFFFFYF